MKPASRMILGAALAVFSMCVHAAPPLKAQGLLPLEFDYVRSVVGTDEPRCASVKVSGPVQFRNRTLIEIPDIKEPALRLANQLLSAGCFARAIDQIEGVTRTDPGNVHARYAYARMLWMVFNPEIAEQLLMQTLAAQKDFASAKVLLAGIRFQREDLASTTALLDEVEPRSPQDLWVFMGRLRLEALQSPSADLRARLLEIVRSTAFPPNAREGAAEIAMLLPQGEKQYEEILRARLDIESSVGTACKMAELAFWLGDAQGRFAEVIKLLESPKAKQGDCLGLKENRVLLAQAYLMEAAKISAGPSPANQKLLDRADQLVNGNYTDIAVRAQDTPRYATLEPFFDAYVHPEEEDAFGVTPLCNAIMTLDVARARAALEAGADPKGQCDDRSFVRYLISMATSDDDERRRDLMTALLQYGAPVTSDNIEYCRSRDNGDCYQVMLPVMEKYAKPAP